MAKYRKKPVVIDAEQFQWGMEDGIKRWNERIPKEENPFHPELASDKYPGYLGLYDPENDDRGFSRDEWEPYISTLEGDMIVSEGDFIITGIKGERYPCKPDIFDKTYELVE